jgi:hypothetical protein
MKPWSLENSLWKRLCTCRRKNFVMVVVMLIMMKLTIMGKGEIWRWQHLLGAQILFSFTEIRSLTIQARTQVYWMEDRGIGIRTAGCILHRAYTTSGFHSALTNDSNSSSPGVMRKEHNTYVARPPSTEIWMRRALHLLLPKFLCLIKYRNNSSVFKVMINYKVSN